MEAHETKKSKAVALYKAGEESKALKLFATFRLGFTKEEARTLQVASEATNVKFYQSIGIDTDKEIEKSREILKRKYNI